MRRIPAILMSLTVALLLVAGAGCSGNQPGAATTAGNGSVGAAVTQPSEIDVLFVGNSYTYFNDMPEMVEAIAATNGANINATMIAGGGYFLRDHVRDGDVVEALSSGTYEIVVMQEQSVAGAIAGQLQRDTIPAALTLDAAADAAGTRVIWYQTWGRENGLSEAGFQDYEQMQSALTLGYRQIADSTNAEIAAVGESWASMRRSGAGLDLYDDDGSHPSAAGSYVAAAEITETILGEPLTTAPAVDGVSAETATLILAFG